MLELPQIGGDFFATPIAQRGRQASCVEARPQSDQRRGDLERGVVHAFTSRRGRRASAFALDSFFAFTAAASPAAVNV